MWTVTKRTTTRRMMTTNRSDWRNFWTVSSWMLVPMRRMTTNKLPKIRRQQYPWAKGNGQLETVLVMWTVKVPDKSVIRIRQCRNRNSENNTMSPGLNLSRNVFFKIYNYRDFCY